MIEVGEYVRTKTGIIGIVTDIQQDLIKYKNNNCDYIDYQSCLFDIVKHSNNIIDLIEEGDYINGVEIDAVENDRKPKLLWSAYGDDDISFSNKEIKSIVTKQQFKSVEYEVKE